MKKLTWDELADLYNEAHPNTSRPAKTLPMDTVFNWAEKQTDRFIVDDEGYIYLKENKANNDE